MQLCVLTSDGHLSLITVEDFSTGMLFVVIRFLTWERSFKEEQIAYATEFPITATPTPLPTLSPTPLLPTETPDSIHPVYATGYIHLPVYSLDEIANATNFDLDEGVLTSTVSGDIGYSISCGSAGCSSVLRAVNQSTAIAVGYDQPLFDDCLNQLPEFNGRALFAEAGSYICLHTNENRLAVLRIEQYGPISSHGWVDLSYTVFDEIVGKPLEDN